MADNVVATSHAPHLQLTDQHPRYTSIEYPGPIKSVSRALTALGGLNHLSLALSSTPPLPIELNLMPGNPYSHPIPANVSSTGNLLVKIVKRKKKVRGKTEDEIDAGVYTFEVVGLVEKGVRFRAMADFQYKIDETVIAEDEILSLAEAIKGMDIATIQNYQLAKPKEDYETMNIPPPPVFSPQHHPSPYGYKMSAASVPTGDPADPSTRYSNVTKYSGRPIQAVPFTQAILPLEPEAELTKNHKDVNLAVEERLRALLKERPVWTKASIGNQLTPEEVKIMNNHKQAIPMVSYTFADGPFRELVIRYGYDPRTDPEARFYQRIVFRNMTIPHGARRTHAGKEPAHQKSHRFNGQELHSKNGNFQLVDITDPLLFTLIHAPEGVRETCSSTGSGWYKEDYWDQIRAVMRRKFLALVNNGEVIGDDECEDLLGDPSGGFVEGGGKRNSAAAKKGSVENEEQPDEDDENEQEEEEEAVETSEGGSVASSSRSKGKGKAKGKAKAKAKAMPKKVGGAAPPPKKPVKSYTTHTKKKTRPKPKGEESEEAKAERLRAAIGVGSSTSLGRATRNRQFAGGSGNEEEAEQDDAEDMFEDMEE